MSQPNLIHELMSHQAARAPDATALLHKKQSFSYAELQYEIEAVSGGLLGLGVAAGDRIAVYLPKQPETVFGLFGAAAAGACFVPVNPLLKPAQVAYILKHCNVRVLITSGQRLKLLQGVLTECPDLHTLVVTEQAVPELTASFKAKLITYSVFCKHDRAPSAHRRIDTDIAAILYTSGSTGKPKGVVLSHRNMLAGAHSVASYLGNTPTDRVLAVLPLSFDAGLSQLTTIFSVGGSAVLMEYLLPRDVIRAVARYQVTGLAAVPPLWNQLVGLEWPEEAVETLRYITNTGGAMPVPTTRALQKALPNTEIFLMYGLTEAFRSTYLPPDQVDKHPESIGKAIPNAEILVLNKQGQECAPGEAGELVHRGALVAMGYWNDPQKTAERFKPLPASMPQLPIPELAVWSGDEVVKDEEGWLYFVNRKDEMIKTSGYRVSPTEVEEVAYGAGQVSGAVALGLPHATLGQTIALIITQTTDSAEPEDVKEHVLLHLQRELPAFMVPAAIVVRESLPHNQNGKIDRRALSEEYHALFHQDSN